MQGHQPALLDRPSLHGETPSLTCGKAPSTTTIASAVCSCHVVRLRLEVLLVLMMQFAGAAAAASVLVESMTAAPTPKTSLLGQVLPNTSSDQTWQQTQAKEKRSSKHCYASAHLLLAVLLHLEMATDRIATSLLAARGKYDLKVQAQNVYLVDYNILAGNQGVSEGSQSSCVQDLHGTASVTHCHSTAAAGPRFRPP